MGTTRFALRADQPNKDGSCPIRLTYQIKGKRKYFVPDLDIFPINWDTRQQKAVYIKKATYRKKKEDQVLPDYDLLLSDGDVGKFNNDLSSIRKEIADIETRYKLNDITYTKEMVINSLNAKRKPETKAEAPANQVFDFIDQYVKDNKDTREPGSLSVYKSLSTHLKNFQQKKNNKVTFDTIDYSFFINFQNFLINTKTKNAPTGLGNVTIAKQLSTLKTVLNYARMRGIEVQDKYKDFKIKKEDLEVIALTSEEFETLYNFDLSKNKRLDQVRDVFCFSCATGLRYSDLKQLIREHIKKEELRLTVTKTKELLTIPFNPYSYSILAKYVGMHKPLPVISNAKMNVYVKELCELADINDMVQIVRFRGSKREENSYPKHELVSVHTGRKTFATLSLEKGMSAEEVMKIGGWKSYASFSRYVKITEQRTKTVMRKAWGEIPKSNLKVV